MPIPAPRTPRRPDRTGREPITPSLQALLQARAALLARQQRAAQTLQHLQGTWIPIPYRPRLEAKPRATLAACQTELVVLELAILGVANAGQGGLR